MPSKIQESAKGDAWISVLVAGVVIQLLLLVYWQLLNKFPNQTLSEMTVRILGVYVGKALNLIYYVFFIVIAGYACTLYVKLVNTWMLALTPSWVLLLLIIGAGVYLAIENLRIISRFFILCSVLFALLLLISFLNFSNDMQFTNILPVGQAGSWQIFKGSENTFFQCLVLR